MILSILVTLLFLVIASFCDFIRIKELQERIDKLEGKK